MIANTVQTLLEIRLPKYFQSTTVLKLVDKNPIENPFLFEVYSSQSNN